MTRPTTSLRCARCELRCYELADEIVKQLVFFRGEGEARPCGCLRDLLQAPAETPSLPDRQRHEGF